MIETLLIANRGEIAMRVLRTCRAMGIRAVAVYSDADADSPVVHEADVAVRLGPPAPAESYLDVEHLLAIAQGNGVDAIHPGYGFLSENPAFSAACAERGIRFVGPSAEVIRAMGDKAEAKHRMMAAGVPIVPGYSGDAQDGETLRREALDVGFPLMLKAVAGGGGRGIRLVEQADKLDAALESAQREAAGAFGDNRIMIERYLTRPRHVEVQVMADAHGNVIHLNERECSVQRRHQKVVEETPSPALTPEMRAAMGRDAVKAAEAIGYLGAGTVEFLLDDAGNYYFLEMNTRLQVEHPITEMTTGLDLVRMQIEIAEGKPLTIRQEDVPVTGHAIECRLNAENPAKRFLPSVGRLDALTFPTGEGLRVDTGFRSGSAISPYYDSLLAKLVAWGSDRDEALRRMRRMLARSRVTGIVTNLSFLQAVLAHPEFVSGDYCTTLVEQNLKALTASEFSETFRHEVLLAAAAVDAHLARTGVLRPAPRSDNGQGAQSASPWSRSSYWSTDTQLRTPMRRRYEGVGEPVEAQIVLRPEDPAGHTMQVTLGDHEREVLHVHVGPGEGLLDLGEVRLPFRWDAGGEVRWLTLRERHIQLRSSIPEAVAVGVDAALAANQLLAPLPGKVIKVAVASGASVKSGDLLMIVEAMKMEHQITAPYAGKVTALHFKEGDPVNKDQQLLDLEQS
jgi:3-methylcrotonyl-CoA carboxylase alpha subunit